MSFGFTWIAFGLLFTALAVLVPATVADRRAARLAWLALFVTWTLCWLPHGIIGVGVALGGLEPASISQYEEWAARPLGTLTLALDAVLLAVHFGCSLAGFVVAGHEVWRSPPPPAPVLRCHLRPDRRLQPTAGGAMMSRRG